MDRKELQLLVDGFQQAGIEDRVYRCKIMTLHTFDIGDAHFTIDIENESCGVSKIERA